MTDKTATRPPDICPKQHSCNLNIKMRKDEITFADLLRHIDSAAVSIVAENTSGTDKDTDVITYFFYDLLSQTVKVGKTTNSQMLRPAHLTHCRPEACRIKLMPFYGKIYWLGASLVSLQTVYDNRFPSIPRENVMVSFYPPDLHLRLIT